MPIKDLKKRKEYTTKYHREVWYPKNKEKRKLITTKNKKKIRDKLSEYKLERGCIECGYNKHAVALDFDHLNDKLFSISIAPSLGYSWERILTEIEKCEVVCANCHRVRTSKRLLN